MITNVKLGVGFPQRLRAARLNLNLTQEDLAEKVDVRRETLSRLEKGKLGSSSVSLMKNLSAALNVSYVWLIGQDIERKIEVETKYSTEPNKIDNSVMNVGREFPNRLRTLRKERGLTQEELANLIPCSRRTIIRLENGETLPYQITLVLLAEQLGVDPKYLYGPLDEEKLRI